MTVKEWHEMLGHIDTSTIKHLQERGLVDIADTSVVSVMRCSVSRECIS